MHNKSIPVSISLDNVFPGEDNKRQAGSNRRLRYLATLAIKTPDYARLRDLFVELEFMSSAQDAATRADLALPPISESPDSGGVSTEVAAPVRSGQSAVERVYCVVDTVARVHRLMERARQVEPATHRNGLAVEPGDRFPRLLG